MRAFADRGIATDFRSTGQTGIMIAGGGVPMDGVTKSTKAQALDGVVYAMRTVRAGFTTVADLGSDPEAINALRDAIA